MMMRLILVAFFLPYVLGGSPCPPRVQIYPCICIDRPIGKSKFETTVICQGLDSGSSLLAIKPSLSGMDINKFLLYDSYWPKAADSRRLQAEARIPVNHISNFKIDEVEIVDTTLSLFGCPVNDNCITSYLKKFTAINTTAISTERSSCDNNGLSVFTWVSCPGNIQEMVINKGFTSETSLRLDFFPEPMNKLKVLRLPNNKIASIDRRTFSGTKFPVLQTLDLSHNSLREIKSIFGSPLKVEYLDFSHNLITNIMEFKYLPNLSTLKLNDNRIVSLLQSEWLQTPANLRYLDLTDNKIVCRCDMQWVNSTFHISTVMLGSCVSPSEVASKKIRRASRLLIERCDEDGNILPSKIKTKTN